MSERAPKDGIQRYNAVRYRVRKGELLMPGAMFVDPAAEKKRLSAESKAASSKISEPVQPVDVAADAAERIDTKGQS
jgi:fructose 1,6-bisphosphatase